MANPIVECIPNFSEARNEETIQAIENSILSVPDIYILDKHSDQDHNRTVITFIGTPQSIAEAAFQAIKIASECIDLENQTGAHPRIGATDVVPFVPISNVTIKECIEIAKSVAQRVSEELNIPTYLYEEAAASEYPERKFLENIRRGQYEGLKEEIKNNPKRKPDFGPSQLGSAGATVIGARHPLIAFNVFLNTDDIQIAKNIAKAMRNSSGGFHYLKALGLLVNGRAQVSMNFTNFNLTPIARVVEAIRREAAIYGTSIHSSELVGLIPQKALTDTAKWYLQLHEFEKNQILEQRIYDMVYHQDGDSKNNVFHDVFLQQLADPLPTPGGGTAMAYTAAQAASLLSMVAKSTLRKESYEKFHGLMQHILVESDAARMELITAMEQDMKAYQTYLKFADTEKTLMHATISPAFINAVAGISHIPLLIAKKCVLLMDMAINAAQYGNENTRGEAINAFYLAKSAAEGSLINADINTKPYISQAPIAPFGEELKDIRSKITAHETKMNTVLQNIGLDSLQPNE